MYMHIIYFSLNINHDAQICRFRIQIGWYGEIISDTTASNWVDEI